AETLRGGLSFAMSGFSFWSHDISGFEKTASPDIYKRWLQFGIFSSHSRLHGSQSYRVPWLFDEEACDVVRYFVNLKCRLMPYFYRQAVYSHETGIPMMRPMVLEFPTEPGMKDLDMQYMLGDSLLVAPIFREDGIGEYCLPEGRWTHLLSGEEREGGRWYRETYDYFSLPVFVRENTLLAMGGNETLPDYDYTQGVELHLYALSDGADAVCEITDLTGQIVMRAKVSRRGEVIVFETDCPEKEPTLVMHGMKEVSRVEGGVKVVRESDKSER
ncbi:MAG: alpha-xylosidase, partial [Lachnospiraceae bacterium]|nr:alpha-xylosidase [Lachnospiraceae bacterium]